ncbi:MAG TPA: glycosyl hydrolase [Acidobacteriota bacterium]|nr:glycosyl hydrolase [Acidobacteriota bacterium]
MRKTIVAFSFFSLLFAILGNADVKVDSNTFGAITARSIGPAKMSGRIEAIDAVASDPKIVYVGAASGGVWKSINGGTTFKPIFDKYTQSIGAVTVDQAHPDTVWVGTGESDTRNSSSVGTGIYKSTDAGESWTLMGLENSERISRIVVDPKNSNTVYVAVPGHLWNSSEDRGIYKTTDGGKTWAKVLYVNADTGAADIAIDPQDPNFVYASMWQFRRLPYFFTSGGTGSGLYKSRDGGKTWKKLTAGLPEGELGRIAIAVAPSRPSVIYANIEAKKTALYRSDDMGETWKWINNDFNVQVRPFYFSHIYVDPTDYKRVWKPGFFLIGSTDGGDAFSNPSQTPHGDLHALWINPSNPFQMFLGTDGGVYKTDDKGSHWQMIKDLPVSQFYHVSFDMERPYNLYGGLQDNGSWVGPSQGISGIQSQDWKNIGFGDGFYAWQDPTDKNIVFSEFQGGELLRFHRATHEFKSIKAYPAASDPKYRFNWNTPIEINPKTPSVMYVGSQFLLKTTDKGESWQKISPDLTTNDPAKQKQEESGGLSVDNSTAENHCTIVTISASPLDENLIWIGTDDGNLQLTRDGGKTWTNVVANVPGVPKNTWVTTVEASGHDAATAFATFDAHQTGDMKVYVYKTTDYGKSWTSISTDAIKGYAHVIRQDVVNPKLLLVGTEFGLFVSIDGGTQWAQFTGGLPNVAVRDIAIHPRESDVILATHGRGIYIIDDITPVRKLTPEIMDAKAAILEARSAPVHFITFEQDFPGDEEFVGQNLPDVAYVTYWLKDRAITGDTRVEITNSEGKLMASLPGGKRKGINRVEWYTRLKPPKTSPTPELTNFLLFGPNVPIGNYTVKLIRGADTYTGQVTLVDDPRLSYSTEDRKVQSDATMKLYDLQGDLAYVADSCANARDQAKDRAKKLGKDAASKNLDAFSTKMDNFRKTLVASKEGFITGEEQLRERVVDLYTMISLCAQKPTQSQLDRLKVLEQQIQKAEADYDAIIKKDLDGINSQLKAKKLDPIKLPTREEYDKKDPYGSSTLADLAGFGWR